MDVAIVYKNTIYQRGWNAIEATGYDNGLVTLTVATPKGELSFALDKFDLEALIEGVMGLALSMEHLTTPEEYRSE